MFNLGNKRLRRAGILLLAAAVLMLVAGQTLLQPFLDGAAFILYWMGCFVFVLLAALLALAEVRTVRLQARKEQGDLIQQTLEDVQHDAEATSHRGTQQKIK